MSAAARTALISVGTYRQGATPAANTPADALTELAELGLTGKNHGLTRKGSIRRQLIMDELLNF